MDNMKNLKNSLEKSRRVFKRFGFDVFCELDWELHQGTEPFDATSNGCEAYIAHHCKGKDVYTDEYDSLDIIIDKNGITIIIFNDFKIEEYYANTGSFGDSILALYEIKNLNMEIITTRFIKR